MGSLASRPYVTALSLALLACTGNVISTSAPRNDTASSADSLHANCPQQYSNCKERCLDLQNDPQNCSACGQACTAGEICSQGDCVTAPNCGATACPAGYQCDSQTNSCIYGCASNADCAAPWTCDVTTSACVFVQQHTATCVRDDDCGSQGGCDDGACICYAGADVCGEQCTPLGSDWANCGACGTQCASNEQCNDAKCEKICECSALQNCGDDGCGNSCGTCGSGEICSAGTCTEDPNAPKPIRKVDILLVVDEFELTPVLRAATEAALSDVVAALNAFEDVDYHLAIVTMDMTNGNRPGGSLVTAPDGSRMITSTTADPLATLTPIYQATGEGAANEFGLLATRVALTLPSETVPGPTLGTATPSSGNVAFYPGQRDATFYRDDAELGIVIVGNENDGGSPVSYDEVYTPNEYASFFLGLKPSVEQVRYVAINETRPTPTCGASKATYGAPRYGQVMNRFHQYSAHAEFLPICVGLNDMLPWAVWSAAGGD